MVLVLVVQASERGKRRNMDQMLDCAQIAH